jgi:calcineurin-like phosphoesterase family protein
MNYFFSSDTHFNHLRIIELSNRPFTDVNEMNETIIRNWNDAVKPDDTIILIGDFAMGKKVEHPNFFRRLNGHKILIRGNHDQSREKMLAMGWNEVYTQHYLSLNNKRLYLSHIPLGHDRPDVPPREYPKEFMAPPSKPYDYWLCGHVHNYWRRRGNIINVGTDVWNFRPVSLETLLSAEDELTSPNQNHLDV